MEDGSWAAASIQHFLFLILLSCDQLLQVSLVLTPPTMLTCTLSHSSISCCFQGILSLKNAISLSSCRAEVHCYIQWELPITGKTLRLVSVESWEESMVSKVPGRYLQKTIFIFSYVNIHGAIIFLWWYPAGSYCVLAHKVLLLLEIPRNWRGNLTK